MLEDARVLVRRPLARSVLFVSFGSEEQLMLGSYHYVLHPLRPLDRTIAALNLDMIGRFRGSVDVSGIDSAPSLLRDLTAAARAAGNIPFRQEGPGAGRSDDSPFLDVQVPAINFFTGFHPDYHRPGDDWEKIDAPGTKRVATLALELAARLAERTSRPEFVGSKR
jgi:Zn-dependent M28 family amino/carboxypeptidase